MTTNVMDLVRERCTEDGLHWIWNGAVNNTGMPIMRWQGVCCMVRRVVMEARDGRAPSRARRATPTCEQKACVSPHCLVSCAPATIIQRDTDSGVLSTPQRRIRAMRTRRANSRISDAAIHRMRTGTGTTAAIAAAEGVHPSYVSSVRRGLWRRDLGGHWEGLMP